MVPTVVEENSTCLLCSGIASLKTRFLYWTELLGKRGGQKERGHLFLFIKPSTLATEYPLTHKRWPKLHG